ncbi:MAG: hypothetical protein WCC84_07420 [Candidatus Cybelea sp.]
MKSFLIGLGIAATFPALTILAGCSASSPNPSTVAAALEGRQAQRGLTQFHRIAAPATAMAGIYVSAYSDTSILGFKSDYRRGRGPMCVVYSGYVWPNGIAADGEGNLIVPRQIDDTLAVYSGPGMCGTKLGEFRDPYGPPVNAASLNAATGVIAVANAHDRGHLERRVGGLVLCTLKRCTKKLTNPNITGYAFGVAVAKNGDCWLASENAGYAGAALTYWPSCTGPGEAATGFMNASYGGLSIDKNGNLVSVDVIGGASGGGQLWVYSGCNPACTVVGGPFPLQGNPMQGALNGKGDTFGVMETNGAIGGNITQGGSVDIYAYSPTKLSYKYSFATGLAPAASPEGFAYSPALQQ